mmetsp:Transcript_7765/g.20017  ORF Transcript_7765/g.20017 Transcript_7765/m.20017 type:complete len:496 (+) Transcript_7765:1481-2968(+)
MPHTVDDVHHARRDAGFQAELREHQRGRRRQLRGLHHDAVAHGQGGRELPGQEVQRQVPRRDDADDAYRLAHGVAHRSKRTSCTVHLATRVRSQAREETKICGAPWDVKRLRQRQWLACVVGLRARQRSSVTLQEAREAQQRGAAALQRRPLPRGALGDGALGRAHRRGHVPRVAARDLAVRRAICWIHERHALPWPQHLAIEQVAHAARLRARRRGGAGARRRLLQVRVEPRRVARLLRAVRRRERSGAADERRARDPAHLRRRQRGRDERSREAGQRQHGRHLRRLQRAAQAHVEPLLDAATRLLLQRRLWCQSEELLRIALEDRLALMVEQAVGCLHQLANLLLPQWEGVVAAEHDAVSPDGARQQAKHRWVEDGGVDMEATHVLPGWPLRFASGNLPLPPCIVQPPEQCWEGAATVREANPQRLGEPVKGATQDHARDGEVRLSGHAHRPTHHEVARTVTWAHGGHLPGVHQDREVLSSTVRQEGHHAVIV